MIACLSPNGWNRSSSESPANQLLVGTVDGVFALESESKSWRTGHHTLPGLHVSSLAYDPRAEMVLAGTHGRGLYRSRDGGRTWEHASSGLTKEHVYSVGYTYDGDRTVLYAGTEPVSLFRSFDLGDHWQELPEIGRVPGHEKWTFPAPPHLAHTKSLAVDPHDARTLYAAIEQGALLKSVDGGASWREIRSYESPNDFVYHDIHQIVPVPSHPGRIYFTSGCGLYRTEDFGVTWRQLTTRHERIGYPDQLVVSPHDPDILFMAGAEHNPATWFRSFHARGSVVRSDDGGRTWRIADAGLYGDGRANVEAMGINAHASGFTLFAGTTDGDVYVSTDGAQHWRLAARTAPVSKSMHFVPLQPGASEDRKLAAMMAAIDSKVPQQARDT